MKKKINIILLITIILLGFIPEKIYAESVQPVNIYNKQSGGQIQEYNNKAWTYINDFTGEYVLQIPELGDYEFTCESKEDLDRLILEYKSHIEDAMDLCNTVKNVKEVNKTIKKNNDVIIDFNNNSYAIYNIEKNIYQFYPSETNDYPVELDNIEQLYNCIATYKNNK